jgi:hypothetical protein
VIVRSRAPRLAALGLASTALAVAVALSGPATAAAAPVGSNGVINGCYKAKGKGKRKGALRVVKPGKPCKRRKGEKPIAWLAQGTQGAAGAPGSPGAPGGAGISTDQILALIELVQQQADQIDQLTDRIADLEGILAGITNSDLDEVLDSLALLDTVCDQVSALTGQSNSLLSAIGDLGLNAFLINLGGALNIPTLPAALDPFNCPA